MEIQIYYPQGPQMELDNNKAASPSDIDLLNILKTIIYKKKDSEENQLDENKNIPTTNNNLINEEKKLDENFFPHFFAYYHGNCPLTNTQLIVSPHELQSNYTQISIFPLPILFLSLKNKPLALHFYGHKLISLETLTFFASCCLYLFNISSKKRQHELTDSLNDIIHISKAIYCTIIGENMENNKSFIIKSNSSCQLFRPLVTKALGWDHKFLLKLRKSKLNRTSSSGSRINNNKFNADFLSLLLQFFNFPQIQELVQIFIDDNKLSNFDLFSCRNNLLYENKVVSFIDGSEKDNFIRIEVNCSTGTDEVKMPTSSEKEKHHVLVMIYYLMNIVHPHRVHLFMKFNEMENFTANFERLHHCDFDKTNCACEQISQTVNNLKGGGSLQIWQASHLFPNGKFGVVKWKNSYFKWRICRVQSQDALFRQFRKVEQTKKFKLHDEYFTSEASHWALLSCIGRVIDKTGIIMENFKNFLILEDKLSLKIEDVKAIGTRIGSALDYIHRTFNHNHGDVVSSIVQCVNNSKDEKKFEVKLMEGPGMEIPQNSILFDKVLKSPPPGCYHMKLDLFHLHSFLIYLLELISPPSAVNDNDDNDVEGVNDKDDNDVEFKQYFDEFYKEDNQISVREWLIKWKSHEFYNKNKSTATNENAKEISLLDKLKVHVKEKKTNNHLLLQSNRNENLPNQQTLNGQKVNKWQFLRFYKTSSQLLGEGFSAPVYSGEFGITFPKKTCQPVAVKSYKVFNQNQFNRERDILLLLQNHENVIKLLENDSNTGLFVLEHAQCSLLNYLTTIKTNSQMTISLDTMKYFIFQLLHAMEFVSDENQIYHGDIACRNILFFPQNKIKLCDFGVSLHLPITVLPEKYPQPKYIIPHSSCDRQLTAQTDIWTCALCIWEILSYGASPVKEIKKIIKKEITFEKYCRNSSIIENRIKSPEILNENENLWKICLRCWEPISSERFLSFFYLRKAFENEWGNFHSNG